LTTHVGSLVRTREIIEGMIARRLNAPHHDERTLADTIRKGIFEVVRKQAEIGIDIPNDGEYSRFGFWDWSVCAGFEPRPLDPGEAIVGDPEERLVFPDFFRQYDERFRDLWMLPGIALDELATARRQVGRPFRLVAPITYVGQSAVQREIDTLKEAIKDHPFADAFMTAVPPTGRKRDKNVLDFYPNQRAYLYALADAMREEYRAVTAAGLILQLDYAALNPNVDDQVLADSPNPTEADMHKARELGVEVINHALRDIPEEQVRFHTCWGSNSHPHTQDVPLRDIVQLMVKIKAQAYSIEAANVRHEHEWMIWKDVKLPEGKILIPGMVTHHTDLVEHPELVAWRIKNYAAVVGKENVIAGTDCGFSQSYDRIRVHPSVQWAKLHALVEGAALATNELWGKPVARTRGMATSAV
jgi:5-methyltetrahydropteroyltriglutamate--homocysteine methyltransferase